MSNSGITMWVVLLFLGSTFILLAPVAGKNAETQRTKCR